MKEIYFELVTRNAKSQVCGDKNGINDDGKGGNFLEKLLLEEADGKEEKVKNEGEACRRRWE